MNTFKVGDRVVFAVAGSPEYLGTVITERERDVAEVRWDDGEVSDHLPDSLRIYRR